MQEDRTKTHTPWELLSLVRVVDRDVSSSVEDDDGGGLVDEGVSELEGAAVLDELDDGRAVELEGGAAVELLGGGAVELGDELG